MPNDNSRPTYQELMEYILKDAISTENSVVFCKGCLRWETHRKYREGSKILHTSNCLIQKLLDLKEKVWMLAE
jgi:hypothetical protein